MNDVVDFININRDRYVDELKQYLAIPSISALPSMRATSGERANGRPMPLKPRGCRTCG